MKRGPVLLVMVGLMVAFASGLALAVTKIGGPGKDGLVGTDEPDWLDGAGGDDKILGQGGDDGITGFDEQGNPEGGILSGGVGNDFFPRNENPAVRDVIHSAAVGTTPSTPTGRTP